MNPILDATNSYVPATLADTGEVVKTLNGLPLGLSATGELAVKFINIGALANPSSPVADNQPLELPHYLRADLPDPSLHPRSIVYLDDPAGDSFVIVAQEQLGWLYMDGTPV